MMKIKCCEYDFRCFGCFVSKLGANARVRQSALLWCRLQSYLLLLDQVERFSSDKHFSLCSQFVRYEENSVAYMVPGTLVI